MTVYRQLKENKVKYRKRKEIPEYTKTRLEKLSHCCRALRLKYCSNQKIIVCDDKRYFTFGSIILVGNSGFYTKDFKGSADSIK